ncbi:MAG: alpha/beta hydrolase [Pseudonocardiales bacterium]|nr:MAG: alpha/beta hydrolase [Pseudonocardiales bacterium]
MTDIAVRVDGRTVAARWITNGDPDRVVVFCHPAPGGGALDPDPEQTARRGVRLLGVDRPGYGRSSLRSGGPATVGSAADDIATVLAEVGVTRVGAVGWSAGGRVALALAARHPELVERVVVVATPAPNDEVPWIPEEYAKALEAMRELPADEAQATLVGMLGQQPDSPASRLASLGSGGADDDDLAVPGALERLEAMLELAHAQGAAGSAADILGYCLHPWGFEPADVAAKTLLLYGAADPILTTAHGRWYQRRLPDSRLETSPNAGHLLVMRRWDRVLSFLAPGALSRSG